MAIGTQAALMTPSIVGVIPEVVAPSRLSSANGLFSLVSLVAVLAGTAAGNWVADATALDAASAWGRAWPTGMLLGGTALLGLAAAVFMPHLAPAAPDAPPAWNALARTWTDLSLLVRQPELAAAAAGSVRRAPVTQRPLVSGLRLQAGGWYSRGAGVCGQKRAASPRRDGGGTAREPSRRRAPRGGAWGRNAPGCR